MWIAPEGNLPIRSHSYEKRPSEAIRGAGLHSTKREGLSMYVTKRRPKRLLMPYDLNRDRPEYQPGPVTTMFLTKEEVDKLCKKSLKPANS